MHKEHFLNKNHKFCMHKKHFLNKTTSFACTRSIFLIKTTSFACTKSIFLIKTTSFACTKSIFLIKTTSFACTRSIFFLIMKNHRFCIYTFFFFFFFLNQISFISTSNIFACINSKDLAFNKKHLKRRVQQPGIPQTHISHVQEETLYFPRKTYILVLTSITLKCDMKLYIHWQHPGNHPKQVLHSHSIFFIKHKHLVLTSIWNC